LVGLRVIGGGHRLELNWPDVEGFPNYGLVRTRADFDELLARTAHKQGVNLFEKTRVTGPIFDSTSGKVIFFNTCM
jgi:flavin-dependent dehydrogenase